MAIRPCVLRGSFFVRVPFAAALASYSEQRTEAEENVPEHDPFRLNDFAPLTFCLSMIYSENRFPLFGIML
jgi:hypothetical protein